MLLHGYSNSSHTLHADCTGVSVVIERIHRQEDQRDAVELAHAARILSDITSLSYLRLYVGYRFFKIDQNLLSEYRNRIEKFHGELSEIRIMWENMNMV
jgi:hypothetical protein